MESSLFQMQKYLEKKTSLPLLSIANQFLVVSTRILIVVLATIYKFSTIYTLVFRSFSICFNWTNFHNELLFLKDKNEYPISFIDNCFKTFLDRVYINQLQVLTAEKKTLTLVLPFLGELSLQTRIKIQKVLKRILSCAKIQILFKN